MHQGDRCGDRGDYMHCEAFRIEGRIGRVGMVHDGTYL